MNEQKLTTQIPDYVQKVARMLLKEGYKAYLVGGAIRDIALGKTPYDWDLATDAKPEEMLELFPKAVSTGARFGMVSALVPDVHGEIFEVEVTTFRSEEQYVDGRWPSKVEFIGDLDKDLGRRDFTINAMAIDLASAELSGDEGEREWVVYDPFDGMGDISRKLVKAVGTPLERFKEDGLRAFKACRLASQLQFELDPETFEAIKEALPVAKQVSMERVRDEFMKTLLGSPKPSVGIEMMRQTGLLEIFIPELLEGVDVEQKLFHHDDVYWHSLRTCDVAPDNIKLAALFHDIGKPRKDMKDGHFYGHDTEGAEMTKQIMKRMRFSNSDIEKTVTLVRWHMFYYPHVQEGMSEEQVEHVKVHEWSDSAVRRFMSKVGDENLDDLFALRIADASSNPMSAFNPDEIAELQLRISEVREKDMALKISDLEITGHDLMEQLGVEKGPQLGKILNHLLERVLDDPILNTKEALIDEARKYLDTQPA
ncbi:MAG: HD domain-containing protein [Candidatus Dojkabacteria bacterium]|nr:MAG: HD domain-containing protein [Candidatus Dojkabacteria bacterium]